MFLAVEKNAAALLVVEDPIKESTPAGLLLSPVIAAAAMSLSSVSVITNALRLRWSSL